MGQIRGGGRGSGEDAATTAATPATPGTPDANRDRILTIPNGLSVLRLIGVPVFLWLVLGPHLDGWAVALLIASAATDWLDGKIARAFNQQSKLGEALDPAADRLYIAATLVALAVRNIIPWWLLGLLALRELIVAGALGLLKRKLGFGTLQVSFVGKTATLCLLYAFPLLLLGNVRREPGRDHPDPRVGVRHLGHRVVLVGGGSLPGPGPDAAHRPPDRASGPGPSRYSEGSGVSIEGCRDGRR